MLSSNFELLHSNSIVLIICVTTKELELDRKWPSNRNQFHHMEKLLLSKRDREKFWKRWKLSAIFGWLVRVCWLALSSQSTPQSIFRYDQQISSICDTWEGSDSFRANSILFKSCRIFSGTTTTCFDGRPPLMVKCERKISEKYFVQCAAFAFLCYWLDLFPSSCQNESREQMKKKKKLKHYKYFISCINS